MYTSLLKAVLIKTIMSVMKNILLHTLTQYTTRSQMAGIA